MRAERDVKRALGAIFNGPVQSVIAEVLEVNEDAQTCKVKPLGGELRELSDVRLKAVIDEEEKGFWCIPSVGSTVVVILISGNKVSSFVVGYSNIDKLIYVNESDYRFEIDDEKALLQLGDTQLQLTEKGYIIKTGEENLKTLLTDLVTAITKLTVTTGTGPSGVPINLADFQDIGNRIPKLLE